MFSIILAFVLVSPNHGSASSRKHEEPSIECHTSRHGITHCWEIIARDWDPRYTAAEYGWAYQAYNDSMPKPWGEYATEKRDP